MEIFVEVSFNIFNQILDLKNHTLMINLQTKLPLEKLCIEALNTIHDVRA